MSQPLPWLPGAHPLLSGPGSLWAGVSVLVPFPLHTWLNRMGRGARSRQAVINCLFGCLLAPGWGRQDGSTWAGGMQLLGSVPAHPAPTVPSESMPSHVGRDHDRLEAPSVHVWSWPMGRKVASGYTLSGEFLEGSKSHFTLTCEE